MQYYPHVLRLHVLRLSDLKEAAQKLAAPEAILYREEWRIDREVDLLSKIAQHDSKQSLPSIIDHALGMRPEIISLEDEEMTLLHGMGATDLANNPFQAFSPSIFLPIQAKNPASQASTQQKFAQVLQDLRQQLWGPEQLGPDAGGLDWRAELQGAQRHLQQMIFLCNRAFVQLINQLHAQDPGLDSKAQLDACDPYLLMCEYIRQSRLRWVSDIRQHCPTLPIDRLQKALHTLTKIVHYRHKFNKQRLFHIQKFLAQRGAELGTETSAPRPAQPGPDPQSSDARTTGAAGTRRMTPPGAYIPPAGRQPSPAPASISEKTGMAKPATPPPPSTGPVADPPDSRPRPQSGPSKASEARATSPVPQGLRLGGSTAWQEPEPVRTESAKKAASRERMQRIRRRMAALRIQRWFRNARYWRLAVRRWRAAQHTKAALAQVRQHRTDLAARVTAARSGRAALVAAGDAAALRKWDAAVALQCMSRRMAARNMYSVMCGYHVRRYEMHWKRAFHMLRTYRLQRGNYGRFLELGRHIQPVLDEMLEWHLNITAEVQRVDKEVEKEETLFKQSWKAWEKKMTRFYLQSAPLDGDWVQKTDNANNKVYFLNVKNNAVAHQHPNLKHVEENKNKNWPLALKKFTDRQAVLDDYKLQLQSRANEFQKQENEKLQQLHLAFYDAHHTTGV